jgi:hypothetical protein
MIGRGLSNLPGTQDDYFHGRVTLHHLEIGV